MGVRENGNSRTTSQQPSVRSYCGSLMVAMLFLWLLPAHGAASPAFYLAESDNTSLNQLVRNRLQAELEDEARLHRYSGNGDLPKDALVVTMGSSILQEVRANHPNNPVLALFVSEPDVAAINDQSPSLSAIYSNPPLVRQARLGQLIIPRATTVALLASPGQANGYEALVGELMAEGLEARVFVVSSESALIRTLGRALTFGDFLLGTPDDSIYNRSTIKHLLLTSYRQNRMLIGPGRAFVRAGSVASTFTPVTDQVDDAAGLIRGFFDTGQLAPPQYPSTFDIEVNRQVARSLDLPVPDTESLKQSLLEMEARQND